MLNLRILFSPPPPSLDHGRRSEDWTIFPQSFFTPLSRSKSSFCAYKLVGAWPATLAFLLLLSTTFFFLYARALLFQFKLSTSKVHGGGGWFLTFNVVVGVVVAHGKPICKMSKKFNFPSLMQSQNWNNLPWISRRLKQRWVVHKKHFHRTWTRRR